MAIPAQGQPGVEVPQGPAERGGGRGAEGSVPVPGGHILQPGGRDGEFQGPGHRPAHPEVNGRGQPGEQPERQPRHREPGGKVADRDHPEPGRSDKPGCPGRVGQEPRQLLQPENPVPVRHPDFDLLERDAFQPQGRRLD